MVHPHPCPLPPAGEGNFLWFVVIARLPVSYRSFSARDAGDKGRKGFANFNSMADDSDFSRTAPGLTLSPFTASSIFSDKMADRFFQPVEGKLKHREDHADRLNGADVGPLHLGAGVQPDGVAKEGG